MAGTDAAEIREARADTGNANIIRNSLGNLSDHEGWLSLTGKSLLPQVSLWDFLGTDEAKVSFVKPLCDFALPFFSDLAHDV